MGERTLHWNCKAINALTGALVTEGRATRVYARINEDGTLSSAVIPEPMRRAFSDTGLLKHLDQDIEKEPEYRHPPARPPPPPSGSRRRSAPTSTSSMVTGDHDAGEEDLVLTGWTDASDLNVGVI